MWTAADAAGDSDKVRPWNYRTVSCSFFEKGLCKHGSACHFVHTSEPTPASRQRTAIIDSDKCTHETEEAKLDSLANDMDMIESSSTSRSPVVGRNYRTQPCKFFPIGSCSKGAMCTFIHESDEDFVQQTAATGPDGADVSTDAPLSSDESESFSEESTIRSAIASPESRGLEGMNIMQVPQSPHPRRHEYGSPPDYAPPPSPPITPPWRNKGQPASKVDALPEAAASVVRPCLGVTKGPPWEPPIPPPPSPPALSTPAADADASRTAHVGSMIKVHIWSGEQWRNEVWNLEELETECSKPKHKPGY